MCGGRVIDSLASYRDGTGVFGRHCDLDHAQSVEPIPGGIVRLVRSIKRPKGVMRNWMLTGGVALALAMTGCGSGDTDRQAVTSSASAPTSSGPKQPGWNPCKALPDSAIRAAGADPATRTEGISDAPAPGWEICGWDSVVREDSGISPLWVVSVFSGTRSLEETHQHPQFESFTPITLGNRKAEVAPDKPGDPPRPDRGCNIVVPNSEGTVLITLNWRTRRPPENPCNVVTRIGMAFQNYLPAN